MPRTNILTLLQGGDRRTIGRSDQVAEMVSGDAHWSLVRVCSGANARRGCRGKGHAKASRPCKNELLGLMAETQEQELRWHLAVLVPRPELNARERQVAISSLHRYLEDRSSIVKTFALQGLVDLVKNGPGMRSRVIDIVRQAIRHATPAMKACSRKLLTQLERV